LIQILLNRIGSLDILWVDFRRKLHTEVCNQPHILRLSLRYSRSRITHIDRCCNLDSYWGMEHSLHSPVEVL